MDGVLSGRRLAVKDTIAIAGVPMTCGSRLLDGSARPPHHIATGVDIPNGRARSGRQGVQQFKHHARQGLVVRHLVIVEGKPRLGCQLLKFLPRWVTHVEVSLSVVAWVRRVQQLESLAQLVGVAKEAPRRGCPVNRDSHPTVRKDHAGTNANTRLGPPLRLPAAPEMR